MSREGGEGLMWYMSLCVAHSYSWFIYLLCGGCGGLKLSANEECWTYILFRLGMFRYCLLRDELIEIESEEEDSTEYIFFADM